MKKLILTAVLSAASLAGFSQGTIDVGNITKSVFISPIFAPNPASPTVQQTGQPSTTVYSGAFPAGTTAYGGAALQGTGYDMVFFYSLSTSPGAVTMQNASSLMSIATIVPFRTATTATASPAGGIITIPTLTINGKVGGQQMSFLYAAFSTEGGTVTDWATALSKFNAGDSNEAMGIGTVTIGTLNGTDTNGNPVVGNSSQQGWSSFSLVINQTPEPSTIALAGLGAAGLLLFRRRK